MATQQEMEQLVARALIDDDFRHRLLDDPENTAQSVGITLDSDQVTRIEQIKRRDADRAAADFQRKSQTTQREVEATGFW